MLTLSSPKSKALLDQDLGVFQALPTTLSEGIMAEKHIYKPTIMNPPSLPPLSGSWPRIRNSFM